MATDLGNLPVVAVQPPAGPSFTVSPPAAPGVTVVPIPGPAGKQGEPGTAGDAVGAYTHTQTSPSAVWTVQHQLGFNPQPVVLNTAGQVVFGWTPTWPTTDVLVLTFPIALAGTCHVS